MRSLRKVSCLGLAALLLAASVRGADIDKFVPGSAEGVVTLNVKQILESDLVKKYALDKAKELLKDPNIAKLTEALGIDPLKDINSITLAARGDLQKSKKLVVIIRGNFDEKKIQDAATAAAKGGDFKYENAKEGKFTLHTLSKDSESFYGVFVDKGTIVASLNKELLLDVVNDKGGKLDAKLASAMGKATGKESFFAAGMVTDDLKALAKANDVAKNLVEKLEYSTTSISVTDGIKLLVTVQTTDAEAAAGMKLLVGGIGLPAIKKQIADNPLAPPFVKDLLEKVKVTTEKSTLVISLDVSAEMIEKIIKDAGK
jgi:hypothetical protein